MNTDETQSTAGDIAQYFLSFAYSTGDLLTNLKLQKLVYYAQAWNLAVTNEPLFPEDFEAWVHGPVIRELYEMYNGGSEPIFVELPDDHYKALHERFTPDTRIVMDDVLEVYFPESAYRLEQMTHEEEPWLKAREGLEPFEPSTNIIEKQWMREFYAPRVLRNA